MLRRYLSGERTPPPEMTAAWERVCGLAHGEKIKDAFKGGRKGRTDDANRAGNDDDRAF